MVADSNTPVKATSTEIKLTSYPEPDLSEHVAYGSDIQRDKGTLPEKDKNG